jgi:2'-5' RNA ligase
MRMFVGVTPSPAAVEDLDAFLDVRRGAAGFRWTSSEQWHLTLAFMADVRERNLEVLADRLATVAHKRCSFSARIVGGGAFPHVGKAKVLWGGVAASEPAELDRLVAGSRAAAVQAGVTVDGRRFRAHLTLARMGRPVEASNWVRLLDAYRGPEWQVDHIALIESHLGEGPRGRPRYEVSGSVPLADRTSHTSELR